MRDEGRTAKEITDSLKDYPHPPSYSAVKKLLARARAEPEKAVSKLASTPAGALPPVVLDADQNADLAFLLLDTAKRQIKTRDGLLGAINEYMALDSKNLPKQAVVEFIERRAQFALMGLPTLSKFDSSASAGGGGSGDDSGKENSPARNARDRLASLPTA
jgi:hypothetical protein